MIIQNDLIKALAKNLISQLDHDGVYYLTTETDYSEISVGENRVMVLARNGQDIDICPNTGVAVCSEGSVNILELLLSTQIISPDRLVEQLIGKYESKAL